jgi:hypothetical protein
MQSLGFSHMTSATWQGKPMLHYLRQEMPCIKAGCAAEAGEAPRIACQDLQQVEQDKLLP